MQRRQPSTALAAANRASIRRRSGALGYFVNSHPSVLPSSLGEEPRNENPAAPCNEPTVCLVHPRVPSPPLLPLSDFASDAYFPDVDQFTSRVPQERKGHEPAILYAVPLTPRPDVSSWAVSDYSSQTSASIISRLPTPDFTAPARSNRSSNLSTILYRGLSFISFHRPPAVPFFSSAKSSTSFISKRPHSSRSESDKSGTSEVSSGKSYYTSSSVDTGHSLLIPSIGTTEKFTHKWPKPRSLQHFNSRRGSRWVDAKLNRGGSVIASALEDGQGLGMNRVDKWSLHKWCLIISVTSVFAYGSAALACAILTWFRTWELADVMYVADYDILVLVTLSGSILLFVSLVGISGALLNSRPILAVYSLLLWPAFISILAIGYISYKRSTFSLDRKLNLAWSEYYTPLGRLLIQDSLECCGFYDALHDAIPSKRCYSRTSLPGCKGILFRFERNNLSLIWSATFSIVPLHIVNMAVALLTANHMTNTFGKGIMPKKYRLCGMDVRRDAEKLFGPVTRPDMSRAPSSGVFREDRNDRAHLLIDDFADSTT